MTTALERCLLQIDQSAPGAVQLDRDVRETFSHDESETRPVLPEAVIRPRSAEEVPAILRACHQHEIPITPRSGGTGRAGGSVPVPGGLVLNLEGFDAIKDIDEANLRVVLEPGVILADLQRSVESLGLFYPPDPNSQDSCRLGGNLACNAGGPRAFKYGVTRNFVLSMQAVTATGDSIRVGKPTAKGVTGYDLAGLIVGSEGTLAVITEATLKLIPMPEKVGTLLVFFADELQIVTGITKMTKKRVLPRCVEFFDVAALNMLQRQAGLPVPDGATAMLLVEVDGEEMLVERELEEVAGQLLDDGALDVFIATSPSERNAVWAARRKMGKSIRAENNFKLSEDVVVPRTEIGELLQASRTIADREGIRTASYGHAGDGNLHVNLLWDDESQRPAVDRAIRSLFEKTIELGGTLSGEHGIGVLKAPYLPLEQPPHLIDLQERLKTVFDPRGILNPGKIFPASAHRFHGGC